MKPEPLLLLLPHPDAAATTASPQHARASQPKTDV
jgi:hypothetical protein